MLCWIHYYIRYCMMFINIVVVVVFVVILLECARTAQPNQSISNNNKSSGCLIDSYIIEIISIYTKKCTQTHLEHFIRV